MSELIQKTIEAMPTEADASLAELSSRTLAAYLQSTENPSFQIKQEGMNEVEVAIPSVALKLLVDILTEMAEGNSVSLNAIHQELTTQEAANLLNVSRPFFVKLLEEGEIPFKKVGTHRRVLAQDVLSYKAKNESERLKVLKKLSKEAQKHNMGYE